MEIALIASAIAGCVLVFAGAGGVAVAIAEDRRPRSALPVFSAFAGLALLLVVVLILRSQPEAATHDGTCVVTPLDGQTSEEPVQGEYRFHCEITVDD